MLRFYKIFRVFIFALAAGLIFMIFRQSGLLPELMGTVPDLAWPEPYHDESRDSDESRGGSDMPDGISSREDTPLSEEPEPAGESEPGADRGTHGEGGAGTEPGERPGALYLTGEEVAAMSGISFADKLLGLSIMKKVGWEDIGRIYSISKDGVTYDEMEEIRRILEKYLPEGDMEKLNDLLVRHKKVCAGEN